MLATSKVTISRFTNSQGLLATTDQLGVEEPLEIRIVINHAEQDVKGQQLSLTMRTPGHDRELVCGFLLSEGIIDSGSQLLQVACCGGKNGTPDNTAIALVSSECKTRLFPGRNRHTPSNSSCGLCGKTSLDAVNLSGLKRVASPPAPALSPAKVLRYLRLTEKYRLEHSPSGGLHTIAVFSAQGKLLCLHEDVGRHNAMDKCLGSLSLNHQPGTKGNVAFLSGRVSWEMMLKAIRGQLSAVVARGAPTNLALELARQYNTALIGFTRPGYFNLYYNNGIFDLNGE